MKKYFVLLLPLLVLSVTAKASSWVEFDCNPEIDTLTGGVNRVTISTNTELSAGATTKIYREFSECCGGTDSVENTDWTVLERRETSSSLLIQANQGTITIRFDKRMGLHKDAFEATIQEKTRERPLMTSVLACRRINKVETPISPAEYDCGLMQGLVVALQNASARPVPLIINSSTYGPFNGPERLRYGVNGVEWLFAQNLSRLSTLQAGLDWSIKNAKGASTASFISSIKGMLGSVPTSASGNLDSWLNTVELQFRGMDAALNQASQVRDIACQATERKY